ncbi:MAG TPA: RNA polymerase sigma factor [Phycisphaerales bacterium]|nr:RNA polymerase sigma factor [Phycisphaerales bacterium]
MIEVGGAAQGARIDDPVPQAAGSPGVAAAAPERGEGEPSDAELMECVRAGDAAAFALLYERHKGWVVAVAYRFCGDRELALDVLQETFTFLLRRAPTLTLKGRLTTYLFPAVRNLSQTARRKKVRMGGGEAAERAGTHAGAEAGPADADGELQRALATLPETQRELIYMRYVAGMMPTEIAAALGVPVGTAKSRLFAAVRAVEAALQSRGEN